ncbi:MAG: hypothetical protein MSB10_06340 [Clostridiales bacterium]|uniref:hypothetical protein n=1 Tax=Flavonifractor porci TaxID=3133422 RepID=UPI003097DE01|nr:hypothetical protein [Clostridiales bacterium]
MTGGTKPCPSCGAPLPSEASFCPHCMEALRPRREAEPPLRRWLRPLRRVVLLAVLAALAAAVCLLYDAVTPDTYDGWGELTYRLNDNDYHLAVTFRNDSTPEPVYTVQTIEDWDYDRAAKLFVTHVDSGADAGQVFRQQIETIQVQVVQAQDNPSPITWQQPTYQGDSAAEGMALSPLYFDGQSRGAAEIRWTLNMKNGDTILLRHKMVIEPVDVVDYTPEGYDMDTIEDLQALVDQIQAEIPLPTVVRINLPPVHYEGGLTITGRPINLYGTVDDKKMRTAFLGPVTVDVDRGPQCFIENIDFRGSGSGTGLTVEADGRVRDCLFTGWDTGLLVGGDDWADPTGCWFEDNGVGFRFDSVGDYVNGNMLEGNTFRNNGTAVELLRVPGAKILYFNGCAFSGNGLNLSNPAGHPTDLTRATFD